jgi:hypothetical protein
LRLGFLLSGAHVTAMQPDSVNQHKPRRPNLTP